MEFIIIDDDGNRRKVKSEDIAEVFDTMDVLVKRAIQKLKTAPKVSWNSLGVEKIKKTLGDFYSTRNYLLRSYKNLKAKRDGAKDSKEREELDKNLKSLVKFVMYWNTGNNSGNGMYYKLQKLQEAVDAYNTRVSDDNKIESVEEITGYKIRYSVKTNYFPY